MDAQDSITEPLVSCPQCSHRFPLSKALMGSIEADLTKQMEEKYALRERQLSDELEQKIRRAASRAVEKATTESSAELTALRQQVGEQRDVIDQLQSCELEQRKRARDLEAREKALSLSVERELDARTKDIEETTAKRVLEQHRLKEAEKDRLVADLRKQLEEAVLKAQRGSQELQGEVAECDMEEQLRQAFSRDEVLPVPKGQRGGDVLQRVIDPLGKLAGTIIWERKSAKRFQDLWIEKLRCDQRAHHADLAVLVSPVLPPSVPVIGQYGGVWVATPSAALAIGVALRSQLLEVARTRVVAEGLAEKQSTLLAYVSGTEFRQRVEAVLDPLLSLIEDFERERRISETGWARRQKRHEQLMRGIAGLWGDVSGIIGTLPPPKQLQPPVCKEGEEAA